MKFNAANDPRFDDLRSAYRAAAATAERPEATAADHAAWLAAQSAYYNAGGRDPANGWPRTISLGAGVTMLRSDGQRSIAIDGVWIGSCDDAGRVTFSPTAGAEACGIVRECAAAVTL